MSEVMKFFTYKPNTTKAICLLCDSELEKTAKGTTSGLINHITGSHKISKSKWSQVVISTANKIMLTRK